MVFADSQLESAMQNKKALFDNVFIDLSLQPCEDPSTDFSDEDLTEDKVSQNRIAIILNHSTFGICSMISWLSRE